MHEIREHINTHHIIILYRKPSDLHIVLREWDLLRQIDILLDHMLTLLNRAADARIPQNPIFLAQIHLRLQQLDHTDLDHDVEIGTVENRFVGCECDGG